MTKGQLVAALAARTGNSASTIRKVRLSESIEKSVSAAVLVRKVGEKNVFAVETGVGGA